jgi:hypothetical protein
MGRPCAGASVSLGKSSHVGAKIVIKLHPTVGVFGGRRAVKRCEFTGGLVATALILPFAITSAHAFDFEYMETEKAYNTTIKDEIEKAALAARMALKLKAESLGMTVRAVDVRKLNEILRNKAYLYASCLDRAIRARSGSSRVDLKSYSASCVKEGLKIADQIDRSAWSEWGLDVSNFTFDTRGCTVEASLPFNKSYDFLLEDDEQPGHVHSFDIEVFDYYGFKKCILEQYKFLRRYDPSSR